MQRELELAKNPKGESQAPSPHSSPQHDKLLSKNIFLVELLMMIVVMLFLRLFCFVGESIDDFLIAIVS